MKEKKITINDLARMVNRGFNATNKRMDLRFDGIDARLNKIDSRLDNIEKVTLDDHGKRIQKLEHKVEYIENTLDLPAEK